MPTQAYHTKDGKRVPGTTTIISNCKIGGIDGLLYWANTEGLEGRNYHDSRQKAADAGTIAHEMVECHIRKKPFNPTPHAPELLDVAQHAFDGFLKWAGQTQLQSVETEMPLVSEKYRYGGTMDTVLLDGELSMGDWKTSNSIYPDYLIQLAAYANLWRENFPKRKLTGGFHLLRFSKPRHPDDPVQFSHHYWSQLDLAWDAFKHMRELYDLTKHMAFFIEMLWFLRVDKRRLLNQPSTKTLL